MNFMLINHYATTPDYNGGTRHYDLAKELISRGHQVTIVASSFNHFMKKETKKYSNKVFHLENIEGINFIWVKTVPYQKSVKRIVNMISFYKNGKKMMNEKNIFPEPDIVIGSTVHLLAAQLGLKIAQNYNAKFVFEERDLWPQTFVDFDKISSYNIIAKLLYKYEHYFYENAFKVIVLFPKAKDYVVSKGINENKVLFLPNGYSTKIEEVDLESDDLIKAISENNSITYIGSHGIANELDEILDLAKLCKDLDLHFIFIGEGNQKRRLIKRAKEEDLNNVAFFESINKNQVQTALNLSTFTIISIKDSPLYKYGFSMNKLYDYFNSGKPIQMLVPYNLASQYDTRGVTITSNLEKHKETLIHYMDDQSSYINACKNVKRFGEQYNWGNLTQKFLNEIEE